MYKINLNLLSEKGKEILAHRNSLSRKVITRWLVIHIELIICFLKSKLFWEIEN